MRFHDYNRATVDTNYYVSSSDDEKDYKSDSKKNVSTVSAFDKAKDLVLP